MMLQQKNCHLPFFSLSKDLFGHNNELIHEQIRSNVKIPSSWAVSGDLLERPLVDQERDIPHEGASKKSLVLALELASELDDIQIGVHRMTVTYGPGSDWRQ